MVAFGVHAMPEAIMAISHQFAGPGCTFQRFAFQQCAIAGDQVEECRLDHKKPAVDPSLVQLRLFLKTHDTRAVQVKFSEAGQQGERQIP